MTNDSSPLQQARDLLHLTPPPGAEARVLRRVLEGKPVPERRSVRPLVLVFSLLVSATAAAVGGPPLAHWLGSRLETERHHAAEKSPRTTGTRTPARSTGAPRPSPPPATPSAATPSAATPPEAVPAATAAPAVSPDAPARALAAARAAATTPSPPVSSVPVAPVEPPESALAREVAAYREAAALVATSPGLALVRLLAHREHFPNSALAPEVSLRIVQAFTALGREAEARREARSFVIRYPRNAKRAEMQAVADGAPLERPEE